MFTKDRIRCNETIVAASLRTAARPRIGWLSCLFAALNLASAHAAEPTSVKGLWLSTEYPAITARAGETLTLKLKLQNYNLAPQRVALSVVGVPAKWKASVLGANVPVAAAMPATNESVALQLRIDIPPDAAAGSHRIVLIAKGEEASSELPVDVLLGQELPSKLSIRTKLPSLRGTAKSTFEFQFTVQNESGKDVLVKLGAQAPQGFLMTFTEAFGSQEISSIPIEAGQSKDLKVKVQPPDGVAANDYPVIVAAEGQGARATTSLGLQISGQPKLRLSGPDGRLSGEAQAGKATPLAVILTNEGGAVANNIELSASPPGDWKVEMQPSTLAKLSPGEKREVQAVLTPSAKAVSGDYMTSFRVSTGGDSSSVDYRVAVTTSTWWGIFGVGIIAIALLIAVGAVARFGRR